MEQKIRKEKTKEYVWATQIILRIDYYLRRSFYLSRAVSSTHSKKETSNNIHPQKTNSYTFAV